MIVIIDCGSLYVFDTSAAPQGVLKSGKRPLIGYFLPDVHPSPILALNPGSLVAILHILSLSARGVAPLDDVYAGPGDRKG